MLVGRQGQEHEQSIVRGECMSRSLGKTSQAHRREDNGGSHCKRECHNY